MAIEEGLNRIWAVMVDNTGNASSPSNTIEITFDNAGGLFIPQPFRPGDTFQINLSKTASSVTLRIFDMGGNLVEMLKDTNQTTNVTITWSGLNGDGQEVKKGPLVAVAMVKYSAGGNIVLREIFLFER